ncbi:MAG: hypothetical protein J7M14_03315 [Planctomycetes bacterium]|nr:hypothetical protein [Planctomycetota bacterium]
MEMMLGQLLMPLAAGSSAVERYRAMGRGFAGGAKAAPMLSPWLVLVVGLVAIGCFIGAFAIIQRRDQNKTRWRRFSQRGARLGLGPEEMSLLRNIALASRLKNPDVIFTSEEAFYRGMAGVDGCEGGTNIFGEPYSGACSSCKFYQSLREKLGFTRMMGEAQRAGAISLGPIDRGSVLTATRPGDGDDFQVIVTSADESGGEVMVELGESLDVRIDELWTLNYPNAQTLWEFDARSVACDGLSVTLRVTGEVRQVNRRRFVRVPVDKSARVANFPFEQSDQIPAAPQFVSARLIELGGPGVVLEAQLHTDTNQRVLVVLELDSVTVESLGIVRRAESALGEWPQIAIELVGLDTAQVAELTRQTNASIPRAGENKDSAEATIQTAGVA